MKNIALYLLAFISLSASAFDEFLITDIRIVGLQRVSIGSIFTAIPVSVGDTMVSPTLTGIAVNMLPIETLCKPTILISVIKNSSKAEADNDIKARR